MMNFHKVVRIVGLVLRADQAAVCAINRHLLHRQASSGAWEQGDRQGRPYM